MINKKCNECNNENENENLYWDNELDKPNMVDYTCLCQSCYNKLSIETNESLNKALDFFLTKWNHRRDYMKNYMAKARADGRVKHWVKQSTLEKIQ